MPHIYIEQGYRGQGNDGVNAGAGGCDQQFILPDIDCNAFAPDRVVEQLQKSNGRF